MHYRSDGAAKLLIRWKDLPNCEGSWELLQEQFLSAYVEDKVVLQGVVLGTNSLVKYTIGE